ncbi:MAG TPA: GntR family transcriptional regulator [Rhodopila sp.]|uniref:GntR family transcriptional regulator n=1 Tax=Rhodopila sp. TaxID=2480087 RepID=UPI002B560DB5|nr:GntR family transcriptional regulator [Rhodopila sp.]HVY14424.1 GntR family transcriptional regulator [Rhodopila sp.]
MSAPQSTAPVGFRRIGAEHAPLRDQVAENLRLAILEGRLKPGERLIEDRLAEEFGVSRNPIREAIRTLASEGLIEVNARRGAVVTTLTPEEAEELLEVRATLEAANARLAARRRDPGVLQILKDVLARGTEAVEAARIDELPRLNDEFHAHLAQAGRNRVLADLMKTLRERTGPLFRGVGIEAQRDSWSEHAGILRAVIAGDAELASLLAYRHVLNAGLRQGDGGEPSAP